jgi:hypothetical protein
MGILDEAIREHLELKRSHGAADSELKRLEDEAFGPPSRPGEPDFPAERPGQPDNGEGPAVGQEPEAAVGAAEPESVEAPPAGEVEPPETEAAAAPVEPAEALEPREDVMETQGLYDRSHDTELDLGDLDLDLEEELGDERPLQDETRAPEPEGAQEAPVEGLDTVEHEMDSALAEPGEQIAEDVDAEELESAEDVLEETPDFLRDTPEDDELWFEQGEPKDFDFEDDE